MCTATPQSRVITKPSSSESKTALSQVSFAWSLQKCLTIKLEKTTSLQENINAELLTSMREGNATSHTGVPRRAKHENDSIPKVAPRWLKYDR